MKQKQIIVSGIQPTGKMHIGNYLGSMQNFVALQDEYQCYFFIADLHSLTENFDPAEKSKQIFELAIDMLSVGIDPKKCVLFKQSDILEHTQLAWILNTLTQIGELERMTQYKDKAASQKNNINAGLFDYPVLMAADILIYKPQAVPVGDDQTQHIELTRDLAKRFNNRFGQTFPVPKAIYTKTPRIMSLLEPEKKMSKSLGDAHCIYLSDEPEIIKKKLARAVTGTGDEKTMPAGVKNLFLLLENFGSKEGLQKFTKQYQESSIKYQELKEVLADTIAEFFSPFREKRKELENDQSSVNNILRQGAKQAAPVASTTLLEVNKKIGISR